MTPDELVASTLYWTKIAALGQAFGAVATAAAVVVSLWIVLSERRVRLSVRVGIRLIPGGNPLDVVGFHITNVGHRTVVVHSVGWRTGWTIPWPLFRLNERLPAWLQMQFAYQLPTDNPMSSKLPSTLAPGTAIFTFVETAHYLKDEGDKRINFFCRRLPWRKDPIAAPIYGIVSVVGKRDMQIRVEPNLRRFLAYGELDSTAAKLVEARERNRKAAVAS